MTLDDIQTQISLDFDSSSSALPSTNSEYSRRTKLINRFERLWAARKNYAWRCLIKNTQLTLNANQTSVSLPSDFVGNNVQLAQDGMIKIGGYWYKLLRPDEAQTFNETAYIAYLSGNDVAGFTLNVKFSTIEDRTVELSYYTENLAYAADGVTEKAVLTDPTDRTKCPTPQYLVYAVLSTLYTSDDETDKGLNYERLAEEEMNQMMANENQGSFQQQNYVIGMDEIQGYEALGEWNE